MSFYFLQKCMSKNQMPGFSLVLLWEGMFVWVTAEDKLSVIQKSKTLKPNSASYLVRDQPLSEESGVKR